MTNKKNPEQLEQSVEGEKDMVEKEGTLHETNADSPVETPAPSQEAIERSNDTNDTFGSPVSFVNEDYGALQESPENMAEGEVAGYIPMSSPQSSYRNTPTARKADEIREKGEFFDRTVKVRDLFLFLILCTGICFVLGSIFGYSLQKSGEDKAIADAIAQSQVKIYQLEKENAQLNDKLSQISEVASETGEHAE